MKCGWGCGAKLTGRQMRALRGGPRSGWRDPTMRTSEGRVRKLDVAGATAICPHCGAPNGSMMDELTAYVWRNVVRAWKSSRLRFSERTACQTVKTANKYRPLFHPRKSRPQHRPRRALGHTFAARLTGAEAPVLR
jgi:hypothetical protein